MDLEKIKKRREMLSDKSQHSLSNMYKIAEESFRVADIAHHSGEILENLDDEFERQTKLNGVDISFLFFATALQCFRQYFLTGFQERLTDKESAKGSKKMEKRIFDGFFDESDIDEKEKRYEATLSNIISKGVPYDANWGSKAFDLGGDDKGLSGFNHRFRTLGHDPILGWIFGTANIMTSTLTDWKFESYHINTMPMSDGRPMFKITQKASTSMMLKTFFTRSTKNPKILAASLIKQGLHLKSDEYSKMGLPLPFISSISPEYSEQLAQYGLDAGNLKNIGKQTLVATLINQMIAMIHGLFYDDTLYDSWEAYEVKTRKILSYSNLIASSSNLIYVAISKDIKKLDLGGIMVTIYRLISDEKFIREVKEEFVFGKFDALIQGDDYLGSDNE